MDSGTTGCLVDKELFDKTDFSLGTFECHMKLRAEDGSRVTIGSSLRTCTGKCLFLVTPVEVGAVVQASRELVLTHELERRAVFKYLKGKE